MPAALPSHLAGYHAVVLGKRSEATGAAISRAYPAERLLRLSAADLEAGAADVAGSSAADPLELGARPGARLLRIVLLNAEPRAQLLPGCSPGLVSARLLSLCASPPAMLQRKALGLLRRIAAWYMERPGLQQAEARLQAAQQQNAGPQRRRDAVRMQAELEAMPGRPLCPCGCGQVRG